MPDIDPSDPHYIIVDVTPENREKFEALVSEKLPGMDLEDALKFCLMVLVDDEFSEWLENCDDIPDDWTPDQENEFVIKKIREW